MEIVFLKETIPKLLNQIPAPIIFWVFMLILAGVFLWVFIKVYGLKGE